MPANRGSDHSAGRDGMQLANGSRRRFRREGGQRLPDAEGDAKRRLVNERGALRESAFLTGHGFSSPMVLRNSSASTRRTTRYWANSALPGYSSSKMLRSAYSFYAGPS